MFVLVMLFNHAQDFGNKNGIVLSIRLSFD